ncbi:MAG: histidine phosphatase family protein [Myxococcaceae bacterium]
MVVLVRHGETEWTRSGQHTGRVDIALTDRGRADAERLRDRLAPMSFARVLVSPLARARETCALAGLGPRAEERVELMEWDYGQYEGQTSPQILAARPDWSLWRDGCPGGETATEVGARVDRLLTEVAKVEGNLALFAHGHLLRVLAARWMELPPEGGARLALSTSSLSVLGVERGNRVVWTWNDVSHLR